MTIKQGANNVNIICYIAGTLTCTVGVIVATYVIAFWFIVTRSVMISVSIPLITTL